MVSLIILREVYTAQAAGKDLPSFPSPSFSIASSRHEPAAVRDRSPSLDGKRTFEKGLESIAVQAPVRFEQSLCQGRNRRP